MNELPKILIVGAYTFDGTDATSITLKNLFARWDSEKIAFVHLSSNNSSDNDNKNIYHLSQRRFFDISSVRNMKLFNNVRSSKSVVEGVQGVSSDSSINRKFLNFLHTSISAYYSIVPFKYSADLDVFISKFKPEVIYSPLGSIGIMKLVLKISKKYSLPIIPHFMDDWATTMYAKNSFLAIPRMTLNTYISKTLVRTLSGFAISEKMAIEYSSKYKKPFHALMNCIEIPNSSFSTLSNVQNRCIKFGFFGGLHLNRWVSLVYLCKSLSTIGNDIKVEFQIYTKECDRELYKKNFQEFPFVNFMGFVKNINLQTYQTQIDVFVHVESFDKQCKDYTRLSISTKIPEYLALKKPILAIGPPDIASIEYLRDNNCAIVVDRCESELVKRAVNQLMDKNTNTVIVNNAFELFLKNHTQDGQFSKLKEQMLVSVGKIAKKRAYFFL